MKRLFIPTALSILVIANLSCSRANYTDERTQNSPQTISENTTNNNTLSTIQANSFEIFEGETKKLIVTLDQALTEDSTFQWKVITDERNADVNVQSRIKTIEGTSSGQAEDKSIEIELIAQDIDQDRQADQYYKILITNVASQSTTTAELKLIDQVIETGLKALAMSNTVVNDNNFITLSLNEASTEDIVVDIETEDQTAQAGINYISIKQQIVIPKGETKIQVPLNINKIACEKEKTFLVKIKSSNQVQLLNESIQVIITKDESCAKKKEKGPTLD